MKSEPFQFADSLAANVQKPQIQELPPKDPMIGQYLVSVHNGQTLIWSKPYRSSRPLVALETAMNDMPTKIAMNVIGDMNPGWSLSCRQFNDYVI